MLLRIVTIALGLVIPAPVLAAELLMFRDDGCVWCARWEAEVAPRYQASPEGQIAPLTRYDIRRDPLPDGLELNGRVRYTPTFVLVEQDREVGRIMGYPGETAFWALLNALIERLEPGKERPQDSASAAVDGGNG